ncbi:hypothetical protein [Streptomyces sp. NBC_01808]|uniref:hypothetical protein n=1 Tax=Streptomyces sp. NBC_01808 TaxID=2975947 RepID=UPI003FA35818
MLTVVRLVPVALVWFRPSAAAVLVTLVSAASAPALTPVSPAEPWPWPITTTVIWALVLVAAGSRVVTPVRRRATLAGAWAGLQLAGVLWWLTLVRGQPVTGLNVPGLITAVAAVLGEIAGARVQMGRDMARQRAESAAERDRRAQLEERAARHPGASRRRGRHRGDGTHRGWRFPGQRPYRRGVSRCRSAWVIVDDQEMVRAGSAHCCKPSRR